MKTQLMVLKMKIKNLVNKILRKRDLDSDGKIESFREEIQGVFAQFKTMKSQLMQANEGLGEVIIDELEKQKAEQASLERAIKLTNERIDKSNSLVVKAEKEIQVNEKLKEKVSEFIAE